MKKIFFILIFTLCNIFADQEDADLDKALQLSLKPEFLPYHLQLNAVLKASRSEYEQEERMRKSEEDLLQQVCVRSLLELYLQDLNRKQNTNFLSEKIAIKETWDLLKILQGENFLKEENVKELQILENNLNDIYSELINLPIDSPVNKIQENLATIQKNLESKLKLLINPDKGLNSDIVTTAYSIFNYITALNNYVIGIRNYLFTYFYPLNNTKRNSHNKDGLALILDPHNTNFLNKTSPSILVLSPLHK